MNKQQPALTVDSLIKFSHKKKFSFSKKNLSTTENEEDLGDDEAEKHADDDEEEDESNHLKANNTHRQPKGSALLKKDDASSSHHTDDSESGDETSHKKKHHHKHHHNKHHKKEAVSEEADSKTEKNVLKISNMFPTYSKEEIQRILAKKHFNPKKCIDYLLKEKENNKKRLSSSSSDIEEWSDGDENIRAQNLANKQKRDSGASSNSSTTNEATHKRKNDAEANGLVKEPLKKKFKKFIVDSDEDASRDSVSSAR